MAATQILAQNEGETKESVEEDAPVSNLVKKTAAVVDNFFSTSRYSWADNESRITLRGNFDWINNHGWDFNPQIRLFVALPGLKDRFRVVANEDDVDAQSGGSPSDDESNLALRYIGKVSKKSGVSFDAGLSSRGDPDLQAFGRVNLFRNWRLGSTWNGRFENRLYYYTDSELRNDFRWYFERRISDKFFFRSRTRFDYQQDKEKEWYPEQRFGLFQQINRKTALVYEAIAQEIYFDDSVFDPDEFLQPCGKKCTQYQLRLRFRQNVLNPRVFYEIWPIAAWTESRDYEFTPAIRFRLEVVLGAPPKMVKLGESG